MRVWVFLLWALAAMVCICRSPYLLLLMHPVHAVSVTAFISLAVGGYAWELARIEQRAKEREERQRAEERYKREWPQEK